ncbi:Molybdate/tungstate import ATP-binding protein [Desulfonema limicola]|uniref:Molybdate/tungstate import ATP-binding protein n=1 Tax=Desulfonema limicola TaxID=45656 RepID=A0A975B9B9_9BACT|nr:ABC transporter ATP-binding protein [Desulfonema limicola]QTA81258.1 Molybdate/tungstate import ATP-binding protein [Desulfonema limicola]
MMEICDLNVCLTDFSLKNINLKVKQGDFFAILGPTGSGKTLLLESIMGIVPLSQGKIYLKGRDITRLPLEKRGIGIVYQDHALFPHLTVMENIFYGIKYQNKNHEELKENAVCLIGQLGIKHLVNRFITNLSGGEKQRAALARALAVKPDVLLLDEPLSSLDPNFREEIRDLIKKLHMQTGITIIMVTHDFTEAHFLARQTAIIHKGQIEQTGTVSEIFLHPITPFAAKFVGMKNIFHARIENNQAWVNSLSLRITDNQNGEYIGVRPENIQLIFEKNQDINCFQGSVSKITNQGFYAELDIKTQDIEWRTIITANMLMNLKLKQSDIIYLSIDPGDIHVF